jgi:hypothetical protein
MLASNRSLCCCRLPDRALREADGWHGRWRVHGKRLGILLRRNDRTNRLAFDRGNELRVGRDLLRGFGDVWGFGRDDGRLRRL